jgi:hypothetical protein
LVNKIKIIDEITRKTFQEVDVLEEDSAFKAESLSILISVGTGVVLDVVVDVGDVPERKSSVVI